MQSKITKKCPQNQAFPNFNTRPRRDNETNKTCQKIGQLLTLSADQLLIDNVAIPICFAMCSNVQLADQLQHLDLSKIERPSNITELK